jgi:hypothetical protein
VPADTASSFWASAPLTLAERYALQAFLKNHEGQFGAFYAWTRLSS